MHHRDIMWLMPKTGTTNESLFPEQDATAAKPASRLDTDCIGDQFAKGWLHSPSWTLKVRDFSQGSLALALVFPYMLCKSPQKIPTKLASKLADSNPCKVWHHKWHKEVMKSTYSIKLPMAGWCMTRAMWILMAAPWRQRSQPHNFFKKHRPAQYICLTFTVFSTIEGEFLRRTNRAAKAESTNSVYRYLSVFNLFLVTFLVKIYIQYMILWDWMLWRDWRYIEYC